MPNAEQILTGLKEISNTWRILAVFWHVYFAAVVITLILGVRYKKRLAGILLLLPLASVSIVAWISSNPFNGLVYALISILLVVISFKLPRENIQIAPLWIAIPGILIFIFGWIYPHFLNTSSFLSYLYSAPTGLIPCPTLSIVIGLALILNGLNSRSLLIVLGIPGLFYGITGVFQLGVKIDLILLLGALMTIILAFVQKHIPRTRFK